MISFSPDFFRGRNESSLPWVVEILVLAVSIISPGIPFVVALNTSEAKYWVPKFRSSIEGISEINVNSSDF